MQWPGLDAVFPGKIYQPLLHNHPTWYAVWCTETESRQADREHIMLSSTAQLHTAATQHNRHWRTYDRHTFAWMSCLHSKSVDAITSTLYDYMCLCGTMLAATQANAYSADGPIYSLTANHHSFRQTTVICIQSNFDNNNRPNTNTLFGLLFSPNVNRILSTLYWIFYSHLDCVLCNRTVLQSYCKEH